jgi:hypothetical protein
VLAFACVLASAARAVSAAPESDVERESRLARRGAGIGIGGWNVVGLEEQDGVRESSSPFFAGYFQKGLDQHLAWSTNVGVWWRTQRSSSSVGLTGETVNEEVRSYVVPLFTALKLHPFTQPGRRLEPFLDGGAGFAMGIEDRSSDGTGGLLLGSGGSGTSLAVGFGFRLGVGLDWWPTRVFGLSGQVQHQWIRFANELSNEQTFKGFAVDAGLVYRFQYGSARRTGAESGSREE